MTIFSLQATMQAVAGLLILMFLLVAVTAAAALLLTGLIDALISTHYEP